MSALELQLRSSDEETRRAAVAALSSGGGEEALRLLVEALGDESWRVRKEAALQAAGWGDPGRAAEVLVESLAERDNVGRRNAVVEVLSRLGQVALAPLLASLAQAPEHRKLIVDTLGMLADHRATPALIRSLDDEDANVRAASAESLGRVGGPDAEAALAAHLEKSDLLFALACLEALNALGARLATARLIPLLDTPVLKPAALIALGHSHDPAAAEPIIRFLADRSRAVREAATVALDRLHESLLPDTRESVSKAVARHLHEDAEALLVQALLEGLPPTRRAAATVLGLTGRPAAVRPLVLALGDPAVEEAAGAALLRLGASAAGPIVQLASELDPMLRASVFRLIPGLGADPRLQSMLVASLGEEDAEVSAEAARALAEIGGAESVPALFAALSWESSAVDNALCRMASRLPDAVRDEVLARDFAGRDAPRLCRILGFCRKGEDAPFLLGLLAGGTPPLRAAAAESLAQLAGIHAGDVEGRAEAALAAALAAPDPAVEVRAACARALGAFDSARAIASLAHAAADADPSVRAVAVKSLASRKTPAALDALRARESVEGDPLVHAVIAAALGGAASR